MASIDLPKPDFARNMTLIGHSDIGGRGDGLQLMVHRGHAYVAHPWSQGFSIVDVRDPKNPKTVNYVPAPANTWNIHLQTHDDLLLVINALDLFADVETFTDEKVYYTQSVGETVASKKRARAWTAGMSVFDISVPDRPRKIGQLDVEGVGFHRLWYVGGRYAYASALLDGFTDYIFVTIDMADPTKPVLVGQWWLPGMNRAAGEAPDWGDGKRYALHHALVHGDTAYACWRDGGLTLLDIKDHSAPKLIKHHNWCPPYGGGTHSPLPLPGRELLVVADEAVLDNEEDGRKHTWIFDIRVPENPISISTFPIPAEIGYTKKGGHFGPHNLHENRPGSFISETLIFATWQNAGIRAFDISDPYHPVETGALVPAGPTVMTDRRPGRPKVIQSADVFVDANGLIYATDYNAGLEIIEYDG
ncbi:MULTISPECIES: LVIVD repeat-containing protein [unclassified Rhizobium]|uniref:LVIVD repeat-containing protein n=1 Tax=unclassified Rhizobium TaxID=2613769 RepID=UPI00381FE426